MRFRTVVLIGAAVFAQLGNGNRAFAHSACRTNADTASLLVNKLKVSYAAVDTAYMRSQGDPVAIPSAIALVTTDSTCAAAVTAYNATHSGGVLTRAYVVALGTSGYVVVNPADRAGEFTMMFIYDSLWQFKRAVAG